MTFNISSVSSIDAGKLTTSNPRNLDRTTIEGCKNYVNVYKTVLSHNPDNPEVQLELQKAIINYSYIKIKQLGSKYTSQEKVQDYDNGLSILPENLALTLEKAICLTQTDPAKAVELFTWIRSKNPNCPKLGLYFGNYHYKNKDYSQALNDYLSEFEISKNPIALKRAAICYFQLNNYSEALKLFLEHKTLVVFDRERSIALSAIYTTFRRFDSARISLEEVLTESPDDVTAQLKLAECLLNLDKPQEAYKILKQIPHQNLANLETLGILFSFLEKPDELEEVIFSIQKHEKKSQYISAFTSVLKVLKADKNEAFLKEFKKVNTSNCDENVLVFVKSMQLRVQFKLRSFGDCINIIKFLQLRPSNTWNDKIAVDCLNALTPIPHNLCIDYLRVILRDVPLSDSTCAADLNDKILYFYLTLAKNYISLNQVKDAQAILSKFPNGRSKDIDYLYSLSQAILNQKIGQYNETVEFLKKVKPACIDYYLVMIDSLLQSKKDTQAKQYFDVALKQFPNEKRLMAFKDKLDSPKPKQLLKKPAAKTPEGSPQITSLKASKEEQKQELAKKNKQDADLKAAFEETRKKQLSEIHRSKFPEVSKPEIKPAPILPVSKQTNPVQLEMTTTKVELLITANNNSFFDNPVDYLIKNKYDTPEDLSSEELVTSLSNSGSSINKNQLLHLTTIIEELQSGFVANNSDPFKRELLTRGLLLNLSRYITIKDAKAISDPLIHYMRFLDRKDSFNYSAITKILQHDDYSDITFIDSYATWHAILVEEFDFLSQIAESNECLECLKSDEHNLIHDLVARSTEIVLEVIRRKSFGTQMSLLATSPFMHINVFKTVPEHKGILTQICLHAKACKGIVFKLRIDLP